MSVIQNYLFFYLFSKTIQQLFDDLKYSIITITMIIMAYQKIINLTDNTTYQLSHLRTTNWVEINDESWGKYINSGIKFKTSMIRSDLCDNSDVCILLT